MPTEETPTFVLAIDGLRAAALGAYGQTAYEMPAFDALAAESIVYDWCYASTPEPAGTYARLGTAIPSNAWLVTDDQRLGDQHRGAFAESRVVSTEPASASAESIEQTTAAAAWEAIAAETVRWAEADSSPLLWVHTKGLLHPWDAPAALYDSLLDDDDPEIDSSIEVPDGTVEPDELAEAALAASCRYAAGVMTLDACLAGWLDLVAGLMEGRNYRLIVAGVRGFALGEHGYLGAADDRLFSEIQQVPLFAAGMLGDRRFTRESLPLTLLTAMQSLLAGGLPSGSEARLHADSGPEALVTSDWMLRQDPADAENAELYVKPDDRWEQNDIAKLEEQAVQELQQAMLSSQGDGSESGVAASPDRG